MVAISGGIVGAGFNANSGSVIDVSGGNLGPDFDALADSEVNISGGNFGGRFVASFNSEVNVFGGSFVLDGNPLESLNAGDTLTILSRDVTLTGLLADGSAFSFDLNSNFNFGSTADFFSPNATLTVTQVSAVAEILLGDVNQDGEVTFADIGPFVEALTTGVFVAEADVNQDATADLGDIAGFIAALMAA